MKTPATLSLLAFLSLLLVASTTQAQGNETKPSMEELIERLEKRVEELETRLAPFLEDEERLEIIERQRLKAQERMQKDLDHFSKDQLKEIERLYRKATNPATAPDKGKALLKQIVEQFPKSNRAGCALQYLGQRATGQEQVTYFEQAIQNHSDCYYGDGVQVGPYARYYLATALLQANQPEKAKELLEAILAQYPEAVTHRGQLLAPLAQNRLDRIKQAASPAASE